jgi:hypothetical protein
MKQIGTSVAAGDTIIYAGTCDTAGMRWSTTQSGSVGTIAAKFRPKV